MPHPTLKRVILLHADAPPKPSPGAVCNGCGVCCASEPCPLGVLLSRRRHGACAALTWDDAGARYRCGVLASPRRWVRRLAARWIAAGSGCDCILEMARQA
jgi:hypothetical protein